jgi:hypothetical protein
MAPAPAVSGKWSGLSRRYRRVPFAVLTVVYFLYFVRDSAAVRFNPDEMMNMGHFYFRMTPLQIVLAQFEIWRNQYRPMGALFYMPLLHYFHLNPRPYHIVAVALLALAIYFIYRLGALLDENLIAWLVTFLACYHAGIANLYYNTSFIYDVLCGLFYFAAFAYYVRIREAGRPLSARETAVFLALFLGALDSKEMAVSLPPMLLAYEWFYHRPKRLGLNGIVAWIRGPGLVAAISTGLTFLSLCGKFFGPNALSKSPGYVPVFSLARIDAFQRDTLRDLLFLGNLSGPHIIAVWALITYLVWRRNRPVLRFCWVWVLVTPLPIEFLLGRGGACLFIPFFGFAVLAAVIFLDLSRAVAAFLAREPIFRLAGECGLLCIIIAAGCLYWASYNRHLKQSFVKPSMAAAGALTWDVIQQVRALNLRAGQNATVSFLNDPFEGYDMLFIGELWFDNPTVTVWLESHQHHTPEELAHAEHLYEFRNGKLATVR